MPLVLCRNGNHAITIPIHRMAGAHDSILSPRPFASERHISAFHASLKM
jgi:hypothetical protein